jgi:small subunit ribosomal protein S6
MVMIDPEADESRQDEIVGRVREIVLGGGGTWDALDPWGRRKLAYEIAKKTDANYWVLDFTSSPEVLAEVSRVLRITDGVLRHMVTLRPAPAPPPAAAKA